MSIGSPLCYFSVRFVFSAAGGALTAAKKTPAQGRGLPAVFALLVIAATGVV
jgi:hypothetical protein